MHILTKILVVFAACFSLALAALTSTYALNADKVTEGFNNKVAEADQAQANYELLSSQTSDQIAAHQAANLALQEELSDLNQQRLALLSQLEETRIAAKQAEDARARVERQIGDLGKTADTQAELLKSLTGEVRQLRNENLDAKTREIDLAARLNDLENQNDVLIQTNRSLQEVIADLQSGEDRDPGPGKSPIASDPRPIDGPLVRGKVRAVRSANGQQFAEIDLGTRDRVRENAKMYVTREGRWLADLNIVRVDIQSAVGRVDSLGKVGIEIREGDIVLSSLNR